MALDFYSNTADYYFFDTDILIDYLRGIQTAQDMLRFAIENNKALVISNVSIVELWAGTETSKKNLIGLEKRRGWKSFYHCSSIMI
jgi:predicted nucleic acid-binding protein